MDQAIGYIFNNLEKVDDAVRNMCHNQCKINKAFVAFALATGVYVLIVNKHHKEQDKQIKKISKELEELKTTKGR